MISSMGEVRGWTREVLDVFLAVAYGTAAVQSADRAANLQGTMILIAASRDCSDKAQARSPLITAASSPVLLAAPVAAAAAVATVAGKLYGTW